MPDPQDFRPLFEAVKAGRRSPQDAARAILGQ